MKTVYEIKDLAFPIKIEKRAGESQQFKVTYGQQVTDNLSYSDAVREFGESVFHALQCDGRLDFDA